MTVEQQVRAMYEKARAKALAWVLTQMAKPRG